MSISQDIDLGRKKLDWARNHMPIHARLRELYSDKKPFQGLTVAVCSHLEAKTGVFIETLAAAGAHVVFTGSEPMSTQDDVVAALNEQPNITGHAKRGLGDEEFEEIQLKVLEHEPDFLIDDAAELTARMYNVRPELAERVLGMCEQTTTGVHRLEAMQKQGILKFPAYAVNDTPMKHLFDNVHGTGESSLSNFMVVTNLLLAGKRVVVAGFGYCGRGLARKARSLGAKVIVTEVDPRKALQAHMEGFEVMSMKQAAPLGDFFLTATGNRDVIRREHFERMKDGAVLANSGHFNVEISLNDLRELAVSEREVRPGITEFTLPGGRRINLVAEGRLVNLTAPTSMGHPVEVMDQTFAMQFMAALHLLEHRDELKPGVYSVPDEVDRRVAEIKLETLGVETDSLIESQKRYLEAWRYEDIKF
jgi:adenosylhomocysteinase